MYKKIEHWNKKIIIHTINRKYETMKKYLLLNNSLWVLKMLLPA